MFKNFITQEKKEQMQVSALALFCEERYNGDIMCYGVENANDIYKNLNIIESAIKKNSCKSQRYKAYDKFLSKVSELELNTVKVIESTLEKAIDDNIIESSKNISGKPVLRIHSVISDLVKQYGNKRTKLMDGIFDIDVYLLKQLPNLYRWK